MCTQRVCRSFDAVLPIRWWLRPLATAIRRGDRGKFIRSQTTIESLLPKRSLWSIERKLYSWTGLEMIVCCYYNDPMKPLLRQG